MKSIPPPGRDTGFMTRALAQLDGLGILSSRPTRKDPWTGGLDRDQAHVQASLKLFLQVLPLD